MKKPRLDPITNSDPLRDAIKRLKFTPLTFGILILILDLIVDGLMVAYFNHFHWPDNMLFTTSDKTYGLLEDYMAIITDFFYTPIIAGVYLWSINGSTEVFQRLLDSGIFVSKKELTKLINQYRLIFNNKYIFYVIAFASFAFSISQIAAYNKWVPWITVGGYIELWPPASYGRAPFWFLMFYSVLFSAYNVGVTIFILRKAFRSGNIQLAPLHPDNCGGLGAISNYSNKIALGIGSIGLIMSAATIMQLQLHRLQDTYPVLLGIAAYIIFAPLFFFLPLGTAHEAMREAKDAELLKLANRFRSLYNIITSTADKKKKKFNDELTRLENIKKLYSLADSFPVWPFDVQSLRRFLAVVTTPLLPAFISIIRKVLEIYFPILK